MDSLNVVDIQTGVAVFDLILPQIAILILIPILKGISMTKLGSIFPIPVWCGWLSIITAFAVRQFVAPETSIAQVFQIAAAMTGSSLFTHSFTTWGVAKVKPVATAILNIFR